MPLSLLSDWFTTLSLVFGGCCSNAITLEQLTSDYPQAGSLITFFQFIIISAYGLPKHTTWTSYGPRLKPRRIPLTPYLVQVALFYFISLLNNAAFAYRIPMAVHIIFRSGGLIISMLLGWLVVGRRYTVTQILSVLLVTLGVVLTTLSASVPAKSPTSPSSPYTYATGIAILTLALLFSGFLGLVQDWTYTKYGRPTQDSPQWQESMFYLHFLALPMFVSVRDDLFAQITAVHAGPQMRISLLHLGLTLPKAYLPLLLNTVTQLLCVAGVHRLTTRVSALSVTLVLVVRKAVSLVLSVVGVGMMARDNSSQVDKGMMWAGAAMVLVGTITYSIGSGGGKAAAAKGKNKQD